MLSDRLASRAVDDEGRYLMATERAALSAIDADPDFGLGRQVELLADILWLVGPPFVGA